MYDLDVEEDQSDLNFNLGGVVQAQGTGVINRPNTGPTTGFKPYVAPAIPGFTAPQLQNVQYTQATQTTNLPTFGQTMGSNLGKYDEIKRYINDAGQVLQIPFKNGKPIYPIPEGYRFEAMGTTTPTSTSVTPVTVTGQQQDDGGGDGGTVGVGSSTVTGASNMESNMMDASRGMFGTRDSSVGTFGSNREFGFSNDAMRNATLDMGKAQFGSFSPMAAAGIAIGNKLGFLDNTSTPNQDAIAGQTAKGMALGMMGFSNPGQISTNEQATAYGLAISAAMEASKNAINQGILSAMTDIGYSRADVTNAEAMRSAAKGYAALAAEYSQDAAAAIAGGTVTDGNGKAVTSTDPTTGITQDVTTEQARQSANNSKSKAEEALAAERTLGNAASQQDGGPPPGSAPSSPADFGALSPEDAADAGGGGHGGAGGDAGGDAAGSEAGTG